MKLNPEAAAVLFSTANVSYERKRYEEALDSYDRALAIQPDFAQAHHGRATVLSTFELKRYEEALDSYDRALAIRPDFAEAHHGRGNVLRTFGRIKEALPLLEKAVELAPQSVKFVGSLVHLTKVLSGTASPVLVEFT